MSKAIMDMVARRSIMCSNGFITRKKYNSLFPGKVSEVNKLRMGGKWID